MGLVVNQQELARMFGVTQQTVSAWQSEGLPVALRAKRGQPNSYDTAKAIRWFAARESGKSDETQKDRLARVQADRIELEMAKSRGELIAAEEIEPVWAGAMISLRQALLAIPSGLSPLLAQLEGEDAMRELLQEAIEDALTKLTEPADEPSLGGAIAADAGETGAAVEDDADAVGGEQSLAPRRKRAAGQVPVRDDAVSA